MSRIFKHLEAGCLQVNLMSTSAQINQLKYTILYTISACKGIQNWFNYLISACNDKSLQRSPILVFDQCLQSYEKIGLIILII